MKVHRCPHCNKPFLKSEARAGKCPVCAETVWEAPEPQPDHEAEPPTQRDSQAPVQEAPPVPDPSAPPPGKSSASRPSWLTATLALAIVSGGVLWWLQSSHLQSQIRDLQEKLRETEAQLEAGPNPAANNRPPKKRLPPAVNKAEVATRMKAALAKLKIDPNHQDSQRIVIGGLRQDPTWIEPVGKLSPPPQWAVNTLVELLGHQDPITRRRAAEALGQIRPDGAVAQVVLDRLARDRNLNVRTAAQEALKKIRAPQK